MIRTERPAPLIYWRDFPRLQHALLIAIEALAEHGDDQALAAIENVLGNPATDSAGSTS